MKKKLLALVMVLCLITPAFAAGNETTITYVGTGTEEYSITVPATMAPGDTGTVSASGTWSSARMLTVTADSSVTMTNNIDGGTKNLAITFSGIELAGSNTSTVTTSKQISVADITNALFGTWSGVFNYTVSMESNITGYLTFSSPSSFTLKTNNGAKNWDGTLEYSTDAATWSTWDGTTELSSVGNALYLRGTGNTEITGSLATTDHWVLTGSDIACSGNIETLLDYATVQAGNHPTMADSCYAYMFSGCTSLTTAPELPATSLTDWCYGGMFWNCTSLTTAPALPATTLDSYCYSGMFSGCTSLTTIPILPATTLADNCYKFMFEYCTSLKLSDTQTGEYTQAYRVPTSGDGTTADGALSSMFIGTYGTFTGTPDINTTYYLHSSNSIVE